MSRWPNYYPRHHTHIHPHPQQIQNLRHIVDSQGSMNENDLYLQLKLKIIIRTDEWVHSEGLEVQYFTTTSTTFV